MNPREKTIIIFAILAVALVAVSYAIRFAPLPISPDTGDWAALGDYFGGILSPILSFLLMILVIYEAVESRSSFLESRNLEVKSQEKIDAQIALPTPHAELVYYLEARNKRGFAIIENIGNATAYGVSSEIEFVEEVNEFTLSRFRRIKNLQYLPPRYKASIPIGAIGDEGKALNLSPHAVTLRYSQEAEAQNDCVSHYEVDSNMLNSLYREPDYADALKAIVEELKIRNSRL